MKKRKSLLVQGFFIILLEFAFLLAYARIVKTYLNVQYHEYHIL
jgi:hypothetical protein